MRIANRDWVIGTRGCEHAAVTDYWWPRRTLMRHGEHARRQYLWVVEDGL